MEEVIPQHNGVRRSTSSLLPNIRADSGDKKNGWPITFKHMGKNGYDLQLFASTQTGRQKWLEFIDSAQQKLRARVDFLNTTVLSQGFFTATNKVNCVAPFGKHTSGSGSKITH